MSVKLLVGHKMSRMGQDGSQKAQDRSKMAQVGGPKMVQVVPRWGRNGGKMGTQVQERHKLAPRATKKGIKQLTSF